MKEATVAVGVVCLLIGFAAGSAGGLTGRAVGEGYEAVAPELTTTGADLPLEAHVSLAAWKDCANDGGLFTVDPNAVDAQGVVEVWCDADVTGGRYTGPTHPVTTPTWSIWSGDTPALAHIPVPDWRRCADAEGIYTIEPFEDDAGAGCYAPSSVEDVSYTLKVGRMTLDNDTLVYVSTLEEPDGEQGPIVVERPFAGPDDLYAWRLGVEAGTATTRPISIVSNDGLGSVTHEAVFPVRWELPGMDSSGSPDAVERITFRVVNLGFSGELDEESSGMARGRRRPAGARVPGREDWQRLR